MRTALAKQATRVPRSGVFILVAFIVVAGVQCRDFAPITPVDAAYLDHLYATARWTLRADSLVLQAADAR